MGKQKFYAVRVGRKPGIYETWAECEANVKGFTNAEFKSFPSRAEAEKFFRAACTQSGKRSFSQMSQQQDSAPAATAMLPPVPRQTALDLTSYTAGSAPASPIEEPPAKRQKLAESNEQGEGPEDSEEVPDQPKVADSDKKKLIEVYTDGSCKGPDDARRAGIGVWFGPSDPRNLAERLPGPKQTNQRAELYAAIRALEVVDEARPVLIKTDSTYVINGMTKWIRSWHRKDWHGKIENKDLFMVLNETCRQRKAVIYWSHVKGHSGIEGNEEADKLANQGACRPWMREFSFKVKFVDYSQLK